MKYESILEVNPAYYTEVECPSCQHANRIGDEASRYVRCGGCHVLFDRHFNKAEDDKSKGDNYPPRSFIRVGHRFEYEGEFYSVLARIVYRSRGKEFEIDEGKEKYTNLNWKFTTWLCKSESGKEVFIGEDSEGYTIGRKLQNEIPEGFMLADAAYPFAKFTLWPKNHEPQRVEEFGTNQVLYFEGEATELYKKGKEYYFAAYKLGNKTYSYEEAEGWQEIYVEEKVTRGRMEKYFQDAYGLPTYIERRKGYLNIATSVLLASFVMLFVFFISFAMDGDTVVSGQFDTRKIKDPEEPLVSEKFELTNTSSAHLIEWKAAFEKSNAALFAVVEVVDEKGNVINGFQSSFWDETGTDSDGTWHESEAEQSEYFQLEEAGKYQLRFYVEKEGIYGGAGHVHALVSYKVNEGVLLSRYFIIMASILFTFAIVLYASAGLKRKYILAGYDNK